MLMIQKVEDQVSILIVISIIYCRITVPRIILSFHLSAHLVLVKSRSPSALPSSLINR